MPAFKTPNIQLASTLVAEGDAVSDVEGPPDRRVFIFRDASTDVVLAYTEDRLLVSPHKLFRAYQMLKRRLFT